MSNRESSRSASLSSKRSSRRGKSADKKKEHGKRKGRLSAKKSEDSAASSLTVSGHPDFIIPLVLTSKTQEIFQCRIDEDVTLESPYKLVKKADILNDLKTRAAVSDFHPFKKLLNDYPGEEFLIVLDADFTYGQNFYLVISEEAKENLLHPPESLTDQETEEEENEYTYQAPVSKPWVSLGSEAEVEAEMVKNTQPKITFMISRAYREFRSQIDFEDRNASSVRDGYIECKSYPDKRFNLKLMERDTGVQVVPMIEEKSTQTNWAYPKNACTQYQPREFSEEEKNACMSSKSMKEFINSVSLRLEMSLQQNEIMNAFSDDWKALSQEETTFGGKSNSHLKEFQSFTDLRFSKEKTISCINWHPTISGLIAVSVTERLSFEERLNESSKLILKPSLIIFWSFNDPIHPQLLLQCPDDIYCFQFCPSNPNIIAGGCINGQVVLWDISAHEEKLMVKTGAHQSLAAKTGLEEKMPKEPPFVRFCAVSSIEHGHTNVITDMHWLPDFLELSRTGVPYENKNGCCIQLVTCSPDCNVMFWDIRLLKAPVQSASNKKIIEEKPFENPYAIPETFKHLDLTWKPFIKATIPKAETNGDFSPLKISLREEHYHSKIEKLQTQGTTEKTEGVNYGNLRLISAKNPKPLEDFNTNYFAGTEHGELVYTDWKMEKDGDTGRLISSKPLNRYLVHDGFVHTLQRSPFYKDVILSVGGWNFAIWKEGVNSGPILQSYCCQNRYTAAHWSLSRPGVFFIGKEDGNVDIWDLMEKTHEPTQTQNISTARITYIKPCITTPKQHFLAVTDDNGTLHILEIPWTLRHSSVHENSSIQRYFEREVKHLEYYDQRINFWAAEKRNLELKEINKNEESSPLAKTKEQLEDHFLKEYKAFLELEKSLMAELVINKVQETASD